VEEYCNKLFFEAKRRQLKGLQKKEIYETQRLKDEFEIKYAFKKYRKNSVFNFSLEIKERELKQFKSISKSKENFKKASLRSSNKKYISAIKPRKIEINNNRFGYSNIDDCNYLQRSSSVISNILSHEKQQQKDFGVYEKKESKSPKICGNYK